MFNYFFFVVIFIVVEDIVRYYGFSDFVLINCIFYGCIIFINLEILEFGKKLGYE